MPNKMTATECAEGIDKIASQPFSKKLSHDEFDVLRIASAILRSYDQIQPLIQSSYHDLCTSPGGSREVSKARTTLKQAVEMMGEGNR